jgi:FAD/FMN-containing dehydrogenase
MADRRRVARPGPPASRGPVPRPFPDWGALQGVIDGDVVLPGSPDYDVVRKPPIGRFHNLRPQAVVRCRAPLDAAETILFARRSGLPAVARSGGHCFAGRSSTRGIVIDVTPICSVSVSGGVATVGAGARLGEVYDSLAAHDRTIPAGCGPTVGIAGLALGGGFGILGRSHGLTSDHLRAAQVVLADGRLVACDDRHDEDLFWALRGAGGGFGVVTSLVFDTLPAPAATSFQLTWSYDHAAAVVQAWQAWAPAAPDELAASLLLTAAGDPDQPPLVTLLGAMLDTRAATAGLLGELVDRAGADPASAVCRHLPYREAKRHLAELGSDDRLEGLTSVERARPGHSYSKSEFFRRALPSEAVAALVEHLPRGRTAGQSRELDFTPWGGAYNRVRPDATAFVHRDARFLLKHEAVVAADASAADRRAARRWLAWSWARAHPWGSGGVYPNFPDPDLADWAHAYHGANHQRLVRVKARYDPDGFFRLG